MPFLPLLRRLFLPTAIFCVVERVWKEDERKQVKEIYSPTEGSSFCDAIKCRGKRANGQASGGCVERREGNKPSRWQFAEESARDQRFPPDRTAQEIQVSSRSNKDQRFGKARGKSGQRARFIEEGASVSVCSVVLRARLRCSSLRLRSLTSCLKDEEGCVQPNVKVSRRTQQPPGTPAVRSVPRNQNPSRANRRQSPENGTLAQTPTLAREFGRASTLGCWLVVRVIAWCMVETDGQMARWLWWSLSGHLEGPRSCMAEYGCTPRLCSMVSSVS